MKRASVRSAFHSRWVLAALALAVAVLVALAWYVRSVNIAPTGHDVLGAPRPHDGVALDVTAARVSTAADERTALVANYRGMYGVSTSDARRLLTEEDAFVGLHEKFLATFDDAAYDLWIGHTDAGTAEYFVRTQDADVARGVADFEATTGIAVTVLDEAPVVSAAADYLDSLSGDALAKLVGATPDGMYVDVATGDYVVNVGEPAAAKSGLASRRAAVLRQSALPDGRGGYADVVIQVGAAAKDTASIYGGVYIQSATTACTAGFPATRSGSKGYYTADHCFEGGSVWSWWTNTSGSGAAAGSSTYVASSNRQNADIMFMAVTSQSSHTMSGKFFGSSSSSPTTMGSYRASTVGGSVCKRGITTGYLCGSIASTTYKPTWSNACAGLTCNSTFVLTNVVAAAGDSGGPTFYGGAPMGITKGTVNNLTVYSNYSYRP